MSIIQAAGAGEAATAFYSFEISNSLRFNDDDSSFLSFTPSSAGTEEKFTFSCWVKRANLSSGEMFFFSAGHSDLNNFGGLEFLGNEVAFQNYNSGTQVISRTGNTLFRDTAAWYNIVWQFDSTDNDPTDGTDRARLYVNGTQITAFTGNVSNLTHNYVGQFNTAVQHTIGCRQAGSQDGFFDGYLAEVNFIDGGSASSDASDFGELKENIWIPKDTSGLYASAGANSFRLQFKNSSIGSASSSTVGADTSGKNNHFASTNIATTDNMIDSCTDNHSVMSPEILGDNFPVGTISDGNLKIVLGNAISKNYGTIAIPSSGKYYFEATPSDVSGAPEIGISLIRTHADQSRFTYLSNGNKTSNTSVSSYGASYGAGNVIGVAVNADDNEITFFRDNSTQGAFAIDLTLTTGSGNTGFLPFVSDTSASASSTVVFNFGATAFAHTPPSGFEKLSTANLPNPAIDPAQGENPTEYFNTRLYTGDGTNNRGITGVGFQPDWIWHKERDDNKAYNLIDSVRGANKYLASDGTGEETSGSTDLKSFDADGFTVGTSGSFNGLDDLFVAWNWRAGGAPSADNSAGAGNTPTSGSAKIDGANLGSALAGSIPVTRLSASTEAGFAVLIYSGTGSAGTIGHALGIAPEWYFIKRRNANSSTWTVYHTGLDNASNPQTRFILLNEADGEGTTSATFNNTAPTSTVFSVGGSEMVNNGSGTYVAYVFSPREGYSKFGMYGDSVIGGDYENTSPFVYTGFRPAWLMIKGTSDGREWVMYDSKRTPDNGVYLRANDKEVEQTDATNHDISFLSNGFRIRGGSGDINTTDEKYIYMAFADQPLKFANGGTE